MQWLQHHTRVRVLIRQEDGRRIDKLLAQKATPEAAVSG